MKTSSIEQELKDAGRCLIQTVGVSMEPILHNRSTTVVLESIGRRLCRNDVVLFQRGPDPRGEYVLHRIVRVARDGYRIRGDNSMETEKIAPEQIIGVMTGFWNGDAFVDCKTDRSYGRYVKTLGCRYACRWLRALPGRAVRKLKRMRILSF